MIGGITSLAVLCLVLSTPIYLRTYSYSYSYTAKVSQDGTQLEGQKFELKAAEQAKTSAEGWQASFDKSHSCVLLVRLTRVFF